MPTPDIVTEALTFARQPTPITLERADWHVIESLLKREEKRCRMVASRSSWTGTRNRYERQANYIQSLRTTIIETVRSA